MRKQYVIIICIFLVFGFIMQIVPYVTKGEDIDWVDVGVRFFMLVILTIVFWLLFFRKVFVASGESERDEKEKDQGGQSR